MDFFNWEKFIRSVYLRKNINEIYPLISTAGGITKWFIGEAKYVSNDGIERKLDEFIQSRDSYVWKWYHKNFGLEGNVLEANGKDFVKFTFGDAGTVSIKLSEENSKTFFELTQEVYPDKPYYHQAHSHCYACWTFFLNNLKTVTEHNIDLRETESTNESLVNI